MKTCGPNCWRDCECCVHFVKDDESDPYGSDKYGTCTKHNHRPAIFETCEDFTCGLIADSIATPDDGS